MNDLLGYFYPRSLFGLVSIYRRSIDLWHKKYKMWLFIMKIKKLPGSDIGNVHAQFEIEIDQLTSDIRNTKFGFLPRKSNSFQTVTQEMYKHNLKLKLEFWSKLNLGSGNHATYRWTDEWTCGKWTRWIQNTTTPPPAVITPLIGDRNEDDNSYNIRLTKLY